MHEVYFQILIPSVSARPFFRSPNVVDVWSVFALRGSRILRFVATPGFKFVPLCIVMYDQYGFLSVYSILHRRFSLKAEDIYSCQPHPSPKVMPRQLCSCNLPRTPTFGWSPICWERNWCSLFGRQLKICAMMMPPEKDEDPSTAPSHGWRLRSQRLTPEFINDTWNERESSE